MEQQTQLRLDVKRHNPGLSCVQIISPLLINFVSDIQCINFALMQGFLPRFAAAQYVRFQYFLRVTIFDTPIEKGKGKDDAQSIGPSKHCIICYIRILCRSSSG
jgi:hypothetical protein